MTTEDSEMASGRLLFRGVPWVLIGNAGYMLSMAVLTFVLPRFLAPEDFGLWQIFQFYALYLGYITFGYSDGVLLRLAGTPFARFPRLELSAGLLLLVFLEFISFALLCLAAFFLLDHTSWTLFVLASIGCLFYIPRVLITFIFQAAGQAQLVALTTVIERFVLLAGFGIFAFVPDLGLEFLLACDVAGKVVGFAASVALAQSVVIHRAPISRDTARQFLRDCRDGLSVVISNLSAIALNGGIRFVVGAAFGAVVFGQVSLALQVSTVLLVVINAVAAAIFPNLRRLDKSDYKRVHSMLSMYVVSPSAILLLTAWPLAALLRIWIPDYSLAIELMVLLYPVGYFEVKSRGLLSVLMKALRLERKMMVINFLAMIVGVIAAWFIADWTSSPHFTALALVAALILRTLFMSQLVKSALQIRQSPRGAAELFLVSVHYCLYFSSFATWSVWLAVGAFGAFTVYWCRSVLAVRNQGSV